MSEALELLDLIKLNERKSLKVKTNFGELTLILNSKDSLVFVTDDAPITINRVKYEVNIVFSRKSNRDWRAEYTTIRKWNVFPPKNASASAEKKLMSELISLIKDLESKNTSLFGDAQNDSLLRQIKRKEERITMLHKEIKQEQNAIADLKRQLN